MEVVLYLWTWNPCCSSIYFSLAGASGFLCALLPTQPTYSGPSRSCGLRWAPASESFPLAVSWDFVHCPCGVWREGRWDDKGKVKWWQIILALDTGKSFCIISVCLLFRDPINS